MSTKTYTDRAEAIQREIVEPIEAGGIVASEEFDLNAIADKVLGAHSQGYACIVSVEEFWETVQDHDLTI